MSLRALPAWAGAAALAQLRLLGATGVVAARTVLGLPHLDRRELGRAFAQFGLDTLPLAALTAAVTGALMVVQSALYVECFGARVFMGWASGYGLPWEFGPLMLGLIMSARAGARNAAELATMQVGGQLEGLRGIALDPYALLVAPRVVAMTLGLGGVALASFAVGVVCEIAAARATLGLPPRVFLASFASLLGPADVVGGLVKSVAFAFTIALLSTAAGLRARGGARAVGRAAADAVVASCAAIFGLDFVLTSLLARVLG